MGTYEHSSSDEALYSDLPELFVSDSRYEAEWRAARSYVWRMFTRRVEVHPRPVLTFMERYPDLRVTGFFAHRSIRAASGIQLLVVAYRTRGAKTERVFFYRYIMRQAGEVDRWYSTRNPDRVASHCDHLASIRQKASGEAIVAEPVMSVWPPTRKMGARQQLALRWKLRQAVPLDYAEILTMIDDEWLEPYIEEYIDSGDSCGLVAVSGGRVIGYCMGLEGYPYDAIALLLVAREYRGCGVGGSLLDEMIVSLSLGGRPIRLEVAVTNITARRLYMSRGFRKIGRLPDYYMWEGEDGYQMQLRYIPPGS